MVVVIVIMMILMVIILEVIVINVRLDMEELIAKLNYLALLMVVIILK